MRRFATVSAILGLSIALSGCANEPQSGLPDIFDRAQVSTDQLPENVDVDRNVDISTIRYVGEDSDENRYWVALADSDSSECIFFVPFNGSVNEVYCGQPGFSALTRGGKIIEFSAAPKELSRESSTLIGDTLLVD